MNDMPLADAAMLYAEMAFQVFPLQPGSKRPFPGSRGLLDATSDTDQVETWWEKWPDANIGIATEGLLVVDVDGADNPWLTPEREAALGAAAIQDTPSGGVHYVFRQPDGAHMRNTAGHLADRVDTRAAGGYIVAAPSVVLGKRYAWRPHHGLGSEPSGLAEPPADLIPALASRPPRLERAETGEPIPEGKRNERLTRFAGAVRRYGATPRMLAGLLHAMNEERCNPPLPAHEVEKIAESVARYEPDQVSRIMLELGGAHDAPAPDSEEDLARGIVLGVEPIPERLLDVPGYLGEHIAYDLAIAPRQQPELALAGAITCLGTLCGRKVRFGRKTRSNLYACGIAGTAAGKQTALDSAREILAAAGGLNLLYPRSPGSEHGVITLLQAHPAVLVQWDEMGRDLGDIANGQKASAHISQMMTTLMTAWTTADGVLSTRALADKERMKSVVRPCLSIYGTSTPGRFLRSLTHDQVEDGMIGRLLVVATDAFPPLQAPADIGVPIPLVEAARWWIEYVPEEGNLSDSLGHTTAVPETDEAADVFAAFRAEMEQRLGFGRAEWGALWARCGEKAMRLALIHAASTKAVAPSLPLVVDEHAARWGCDLSRHLTEQLIRLAAGWIAESEHDARILRVMRLLSANGGRATRSQLARAIRGMRARERDEVLSSALELGLIEAVEVETAGRTCTEFRITTRGEQIA